MTSSLSTRERLDRLARARLPALQAEAARIHSEAEQRASAAVLGVLDHLPEPQEELELPSAA